MRRESSRLAVVLLLGVALAAATAVPWADAREKGRRAPTRRQRAAAAGLAPVLHRNLIANGDAEIASGTWAAGWLPAEILESEVYGRTAGEWDRDMAGAPAGGQRYFRFRLPPNVEAVEVAQTIAVARESDAIDQSRLTYAFTGWLGGVVDGPGAVEVRLTFTGELRETLGEARVEPRAGADLPRPRVGRASLAERRLEGIVPPGTRRIHVWLRGVNTRFAGCPECDATALADNLALVLTRLPAAP